MRKKDVIVVIEGLLETYYSAKYNKIKKFPKNKFWGVRGPTPRFGEMGPNIGFWTYLE